MHVWRNYASLLLVVLFPQHRDCVPIGFEDSSTALCCLGATRSFVFSCQVLSLLQCLNNTSSDGHAQETMGRLSLWISASEVRLLLRRTRGWGGAFSRIGFGPYNRIPGNPMKKTVKKKSRAFYGRTVQYMGVENFYGAVQGA